MASVSVPGDDERRGASEGGIMADDGGWVDRELYPFTDRFVEVDGCRIHYVDEGTGPLVLLVHGNPTWSFVYRQVILALRKDYRCMALDLPGFGLSGTPAPSGPVPELLASVLTAFIEALDLRDYLLVVQDWGGPIGLTAALKQPSRLRGLVIANTWAWPTRGDRHFEFFSRGVGGPLGRELTRSINMMTRVFVPAGHRIRRLSRVEKRQYLQALRGRARRRVASILPGQVVGAHEFLSRLAGRLQELRAMPAVIVWADRDIAFRAVELERWKQILPQAEVIAAPGAGHYVQSDSPEAVAGAVRRLDEIAPDRPDSAFP